MDAIVLSRKDYKEFDELVSVYTKNFGKKYFLCRGTKKMVSKNSPSLIPGSFVSLITVEGKELPSILKVHKQHSLTNIFNDFYKLSSLQMLLEIFESLMSEELEDERIFNLLKDFLFTLEKINKEHILFAMDIFFFRLLEFLGFSLDFDTCSSCGKEFNSDENALYLEKKGVFVCGGCYKKQQEKKAIIFSQDEYKKLPNIDLEVLIDRKKFHTFVLSYLRFYSEKNIYDWGMGLLAP